MDTTDLDPCPPDATADDRAERVVDVLLRDDNPARRYQTIRTLQEGARLRDIAVLSLRQLRDQLGTTDAAAAAVGITRQAANELLAKAGAPGAREDRKIAEKPAYQYGEYLAAICAIAESLTGKRREAAIMRWYNLEPESTRTLTVFPEVGRVAQAWLSDLRIANPELAGQRAARLDELGSLIGDWVIARMGDPWLTTQEQSDALLGYHSAHHRARKS